MGQAAAKQGDQIKAMDTHTVTVGASAQPELMPFNGILDGSLSGDVRIERRAAAVLGSTATNTPPHVGVSGVLAPPPPSNRGTVQAGSATVRINGKPAARNGDTALTCNATGDLPIGKVVAVSTVSIG